MMYVFELTVVSVLCIGNVSGSLWPGIAAD